MATCRSAGVRLHGEVLETAMAMPVLLSICRHADACLAGITGNQQQYAKLFDYLP
jgi:hypothetical protein